MKERPAASPILALVGPTASGKTEASLAVAERLGAEIVCIDSTLVHRGMDVGTAKPTPEERRRIPHHMLDLVEPGQPFSVAEFQVLAVRAVEAIRARAGRPLLVGGGGLYYRAVVDRLRFPGTDPSVRRLLEAEASALGPEAMHGRLASVDPEAAAKIPPANVRRTVRALEVVAISGRRFSALSLDWGRYPKEAVRAAGVDLPRRALHRRIDARASAMMPALLEEAARLVELGYGRFLTSSQAIGYAEAVGVLEGRSSMDKAVAGTAKRVKALARRQLGWFRRDPRIRWFAAGEGGAPEVAGDIAAYLGTLEVARVGA